MKARAKRRRVTGRRLQEIRFLWFSRFPLCVRCARKDPPQVTVATQLDHIVALENGGLDFDEDQETNRQGLCDACHLVKTREDMGYRLRTGNDADGMPTSPDHPWNANE